jgi:putative ABC transport system permease protein
MIKFLRRIRMLITRPRLDRELDEEIEQHIEHLAAQLREGGYSEAEARRRALGEFGAVHRVREDARDARGLRSLEELIRDVRYGARMLRKRPGFTCVALLSLAIGIGANTTIFSAVNAFILRELPYERPDELVDINLQLPDLLFTALSYPDLDDLREATTDVFSGVIGSQVTIAKIDEVTNERSIFGEVVTGNYFSQLGVHAALGRTIGVEDDRIEGEHPVVMLSYDFWQNSFGGDPAIVGRELHIEDRVYTILGVVERDYPGIARGIVKPAFYAPMMMLGFLAGGDLLHARDDHNIRGKARLAPGVSLAQAEAAVAAVATSLSESRPIGWDPAGYFSLVPTADILLSPDADGAIRSMAWVLMIVAGLILLVVCVNLAGFLLARALDRRREISMRLALGASRAVLIRQLVTETTLLALLGGIAGYVLAAWALHVLPGLDFGLGFGLAMDMTPDMRVLAYTFAVSLAAGTLLGIVPALQSTRPNLASAIKSETPGGGQAGRMRWRNSLVVTQLTVSLVILVGAGLFLRSLEQQGSVDPGFGQAPAATLQAEISPDTYSPDEGRVVTRALIERFAALPGVERVGLGHTLPLQSGQQWIDLSVDGHEPPEGQDVFHADYAVVDPGYFDAVGIRVVQGRAFNEADREDGERVVIVSRQMADAFWPRGDAIGQTVHMVGGSPALPGGSADLRVVGVANDVAWESLNESARMLVYVPYAQFYVAYVTFIARTASDAEQTALAMRTTAAEMYPELPVTNPTTMARHMSAQLRPAQILAAILTVFAVVVLLLAAMGLYGVVSYAVATRTREVGIRMALGADVRDIRRLLAASGARLVIAGVGLGLVCSLPVNRLLSSMLRGVDAIDPLTFLGASLVLVATALAAAYLPARRASKVEPVVALRTE